VRLIFQDGQQGGVMATKDAIKVAEDVGMDLVEVSPTAKPPVCRVMDFGKYKYEQSKRAREAKKNQKTIVIKEIKMRPKIGEHDYQVKMDKVRRFLSDPENKVKVTLMFRGRELSHPDVGRDILERVCKDVSTIAAMESRPRLEGRNMTMLLAPLGKAAIAEKEKPKKSEEAKKEKEEINAQDQNS